MADDAEPGETANSLAAGWYVQLAGDKFDLQDWKDAFKEPFDPVVLDGPDGSVLLRSSEFAGAKEAREVHEKASALVARMNAALAIMHGAEPVKVSGPIQVDSQGRRHIHLVITEGLSMSVSVGRVRLTAVALGPDGKPLPPPPPTKSQAQLWNDLASGNVDVADLLEQFSTAADWYDFYKVMELIEAVVGGRRKLEKLLGPDKSGYINARETANYYRHARTYRPDVLATLPEARAVVVSTIRKVIAAKAPPSEQGGN